MFVYLSKKIAIPDSASLQCASWSSEQGWIACGGQDGLLKVLKLDPANTGDAVARGVAAQSNLSMNQTLEGHKRTVVCASWNGLYQKLTTSDASGMIIVWVLYKGAWFEEMINNREMSVVTDMEWTSDGKKICIVYEDGAVIVGSVEGNRIWGEQLKGLSLYKITWSPNNKLILFGTGDGEVHCYDGNGLFCMKVQISCLANSSGSIKLAGLKWYDGVSGFFLPGCPTLAVVYTNGRMQLMRNETDPDPILVDTQMAVIGINWNHNGSVLAIAGQQRLGERDTNMVQFYNPMGEHLRTLKVPGRQIRGVDWDGKGLRLVMAVDTHLYFANVRANYKWGYCTNTLVYAYCTADRPEHCIVFWDHKTNEKYAKHVRLLTDICAHKEFCLLSAKNAENPNQHVLVLCNSIGTPLEHKYIDMEPKFVAISNYHVIAASHEVIYIWEFKQRRRLASHENVPGLSSYRASTQKGVERLIHVDDTPSGAGQATMDVRKLKQSTRDPIASVTTSDEVLVVGRESGSIQVYGLPKVSLDSKHILACRPHNMALNADSTRLSIVDINGIMHMFDFTQRNSAGEYGQQLKFERKDIWDVRWAEDNPTMFAVMEKTRMYIFRDLDPEEPRTSSAYICQFRNLEVTVCLMDELMKEPEHPLKEHVQDLEIKSLRDSRNLIKDVSVEEAHEFVKDNPHPRLWQLLADNALETLKLDLAEQCFVHSKDLNGIQFVKKLRRLDDERKQRAEVQCYFKNFEGAERAYLAEERRDLAVHLRTKLGDWFRVVQLLKTGSGGGDDVALRRAFEAIGDYYAERQKWKNAVAYYNQASNNRRLVQCYLQLEDYESLQTLASTISEGDPLCEELGTRFAAVGMCEQAVQCFLKIGNVKAAVDTCISLYRWHQAVVLAKSHNLPNIDTVLASYATHLLDQKKIIDAVQLFREANRFTDGAGILYKLAKTALEDTKNMKLAQKLYIMAGIMMEDFRKYHQEAVKESGKGTTAMCLDDEVDDPAVVHMMDISWRGAEAIHFFLSAQRFIHDGDLHAALRMALLASQYDDILSQRNLYLLLALASGLVNSLEHTSRAFTHLEDMADLDPELKASLEDLAVLIFTQNKPDGSGRSSYPSHPCDKCNTMVETWMPQCPTCQRKYAFSVVDGRRLEDGVSYHQCIQCHHHFDAVQVNIGLASCPLCHLVPELPI